MRDRKLGMVYGMQVTSSACSNVPANRFVGTPAFIGSGMLIGMNSALSMFAGSFLAWGFIGPLLVHYGECIGLQLYEDDPQWDSLYSFISLSKLGQRTPSPRYWLLWPGVMIMVSTLPHYTRYRRGRY
jgi:hypothetical protein